MSSLQRVGLYGGTFDPIHNGHLHVVSEILDRDLVDEILIIPAGVPWMREDQPIASPADRLEMIRLGILELPEKYRGRVHISEREIRRAGPSYTVDTVEELQRESPLSHFVLILGSDAYAHFDKWHRSKDLRMLVEILVIAREGDGLDIDALDVSSTEIRSELIHRKDPGKDSNQDLPETIWKFIQERNLYASK